MTEISKAALERARELRNRIYSGGEIYTLADATMRALARVLQEHSDVAKGVQRDLCSRGHGCPPELRDLILPEEPCAHMIAEYAVNGGLMVCIKCRKALKIVEADSHD